MKRSYGRIKFFAVFLPPLLAAAGAYALNFDDGTGVQIPAGGGAPGAAVALPAPSTVTSAELTGFWEKLKDGTSDSLCRKAAANLEQGVKTPDGIVGLKGGIRRAIKKFPDGNLALLDEIKLDLELALGTQVADLPNVGALNIGLSSHLIGKSQVVRPIESKHFCDEALQWAKFWELKTVIPASAKRITRMEVGEIWKLPLAMNVSFNVSAAATVSQAVTITLSAGTSKESKPSVSLRRLDKDHLRLRLRLDRLSVRSAGISASTLEIPLSAFGLENAGAQTAALVSQGVPEIARKYITPELFNKLLLKEINKYLSVKLSFAYQRFTGKKLLLEFILDPNDQAQMESLQKFLQGDFGIVKRFIELGLKLTNFAQEDDALSGMGGIEDVADMTGSELGVNGSASNFAGTDIYNGHSSSFGLQVPVVGKHSVTWGSSYHRYQSLGNDGETLHVYQRNRSANHDGLDIPFKGTVLRHNSQRDVYVFNKENTDGSVTRPVLLYQQYEGLIGRSPSEVREMLENANGVLRYVGKDGKGVDEANQIPVNDIVTSSRRYSAALMSFKLLINEQGVQDIIFAPARAVMNAYMNMMRETQAAIVDKVLGLFTFDKKGRVDYDDNAVRKALNISPDAQYAEGCNPMDIVRNLAYTATCLIRDVVSVRDAGDWKAQSQRLSDVAGGHSKSGLKYEEFFKVMVQLTRPANVSAAVYVHLDPRKKGEADVTQNYTYFDSRNNNFDVTLSSVTQMRERFSDPAELSD